MLGIRNAFSLFAVHTLLLTLGYNAVQADMISDAVLADSPYDYWRLDETAGTTVTAEVGPTGLYEGTPTLGVAGIAGAGGNTAVNFDGVDDLARISDGTQPTSYSIELWTKLDVAVDTGYRNLIYRTAANEAGSFSHILQVVNGKFVHYTFDGAARTVTGTTTVVPDTWYHVVGTFQPGAAGAARMGIWVNGVEEMAFTGVLNNPWNGGDRWVLGRNHGGTPLHFDGTLDEVAIYNTTLSQSQIQAHYLAGSIPEPSALSLLALGSAVLCSVRRRFKVA
jgi:hypothetical protein